MKFDITKFIRLASLVGSDAKNPEQKLLDYTSQFSVTEDKLRKVLEKKNWNKRSIDIIVDELREIITT